MSAHKSTRTRRIQLGQRVYIASHELEAPFAKKGTVMSFARAVDEAVKRRNLNYTRNHP